MSRQKTDALMFISAAVDDAGLSPNAFRVLAHIYRRANGKGMAWFGYSDISRRCRIQHRRTIRTAIEELETRQLIRVDRCPGKRTTYTITPPSESLATSSQNELVQNLNTFTNSTGPVQKMNDTRSQNEHEGNPIRTSNKEKSTDASLALGSAVAQKEQKPQHPNLPGSLETPEFKAKWQEWKTHRSEKKNRLTPSTERKQLAHLETLGLAAAIETIDHSIRQGYTGLVQPSRNGSGGKQKRRLLDL